jgi:TIGR00730 family protein
MNHRKYNSYLKAYEDVEFLKSDDARSVRLQLEFLKPEVILEQEHIGDSIVCFGSARIREKQESLKRIKEIEAQLKASPKDKKIAAALKEAKGLDTLSNYYDEARKFGGMVIKNGKKRFAVVTGGGPGIMEAANRGAFEAGGKSIGFNITLPHEQKPNNYITKGLAFLFHYFAIRKMHLVMRSKALVIFPGGYGTLDETFEILTLVQTGKKARIPIILIGKKFWKSIFDVNRMIDYGVISNNDQFHLVDTAQEAWQIIAKYYKIK